MVCCIHLNGYKKSMSIILIGVVLGLGLSMIDKTTRLKLLKRIPKIRRLSWVIGAVVLIGVVYAYLVWANNQVG